MKVMLELDSDSLVRGGTCGVLARVHLTAELQLSFARGNQSTQRCLSSHLAYRSARHPVDGPINNRRP